MQPQSCSRGRSTWVPRWTCGYVLQRLQECRWILILTASVSLESGSGPVCYGVWVPSLPRQEHTGAQKQGALRQIPDSLFHVRRSVLSSLSDINRTMYSLNNIGCESLIRKMLVLDSSKRIQLDSVLSHPWMLMHDTAYDYSILRHVPANPVRTQCYTRPIPGVGGGESQFVWNDQVLECMNRMGYIPDRVREVSYSRHTLYVLSC